MLTSRVAVVILTRNRVAELIRSLECLSRLSERPQIIVVDNASTDNTAAAVRVMFPEVQYIYNASNSGAAGRNLGVQATRAEFIAFCDDDCWWQDGSIGHALALFDAWPSVGVQCAQVQVGPGNRVDRTSELMARSPLASEGLPGPALLGYMAGASIFRRSVFEAAGGYEPRFFLGGEEALVALDVVSAGWKIIYVSRLVVHHWPSLQRDAPTRRRLLRRNAFWVAWLRLPWPRAVQCTWRFVWHSWEAPTSLPEKLGSLLEAALGLYWVLPRRRALPPAVLRDWQILQHTAPPRMETSF